MMVGDPVRSGLVANFARPGGNITGYTVLGPEIAAKRLHPLFSGIQKTRPMPPMNGSISKARAAPEGRGFSCAPQVVTVQFDEVERAEEYALVSAVVTDQIERGNAIVIAGDSFAIDDASVALRTSSGSRRRSSPFSSMRSKA